jgi:hypothetical protein
MPIPNEALDLTQDEIDAAETQEELSVAAGNATPKSYFYQSAVHVPELDVMAAIYRALKGRGVKRPLTELLALYDDPRNRSSSFDETWAGTDPLVKEN